MGIGKKRYFNYLLLIILSFSVSCKPRDLKSHVPQINEREKVISFIFNNADSIPIFLLSRQQISDSIYYQLLDSIDDNRLRPKIVNDYIYSPYYANMFRDSLDCIGLGIKHNYLTTGTNLFNKRMVRIYNYNQFVSRSKTGDIYFVICRPLTLNGFDYFLASIEKKDDPHLDKVWIKVFDKRCIREIGVAGGIK